jgi:hypothetical protein
VVSLEPEQEQMLARMVEAGREVDRSEREWLLVNFGQGSVLMGPGFEKEEVPEGDVRMLEHAGSITPIRYSKNDMNPTYVVTPAGLEHYTEMREDEPAARQESEVHRFLDSEIFKAECPKAYAKWAEADELLWRSDSGKEFTTIGHKIREALQEFATEMVTRYEPPHVEANIALVNRRVGAVIAMLESELGEARASHLRALGDYSEATLGLVQRQEHGGQKEGEELKWQDARRVVFHAGSVMYEFAESFREAAARLRAGTSQVAGTSSAGTGSATK